MFISDLYARLFKSVVDQFNKTFVDVRRKRDYCARLIDYNGFENLLEKSLDQLLVNLVNEKFE